MAVAQDGLNIFKRIADRYVDQRLLILPLAPDSNECGPGEGRGGFTDCYTVSRLRDVAKDANFQLRLHIRSREEPNPL